MLSMAKKGDSFTPKGSKNSFSFADKTEFNQDGFGRVKPIDATFGGSLPNSIFEINVASAWSRWRRGWELAVSEWGQTAFNMPFRYEIPLGPVPLPPGGSPPSVAGTFQGFPTINKELGMHWAGAQAAGSLRFDNLSQSGVPLSIASVNDTDPDFWYVTLAGSWSAANPLPAPLYVRSFVPGQPDLYPINGSVLEDRIIESGGVPITKNTINPNTQTRFGYMSAVLVAVDQNNGVLQLRKAGSVQATKDGVLITPSRTIPIPGRFFMTGTRYCCSCQDFQRRQYFYVSSLGQRKGEFFPRTSCATIKPGRYEVMSNEEATKIMDGAMTNAFTDRIMHMVEPSGYPVDVGTPAPMNDLVMNDPLNTNRDFPGVFRSFGDQFIRTGPDPSIPGSNAEGMPKYEDYTSKDGTITSITDFWSPVLDEKRFCKHIYAMKYLDNLFPPEPSDFPIGGKSMVEWEEELVLRVQKDQAKALEKLTNYGLAHTDIPPFNCQAPMMMPMVQQLLNLPTDFIQMSGFVMFDKNGNEYRPTLGQKPEI